MKKNKITSTFTACLTLLSAGSALAQSKKLSDYQIYAGSTHAHTIYTASHGSHLGRLPDAKKFMEIDSNGVGRAINSPLKPDWEKFQGTPARHFEIAKASGYDFYVTADHSQEAGYYPTDAKNPQWVLTHQQSAAATDKDFVAITGYEHSENNGPGEGRGHINVINSASYLNALSPGVDIPTAYKWLGTVGSYNNEGPVVATFNHPDPKSYDSFRHRDEKVSEVITMLELINSNKNIHYEGFLAALEAGWKVSPVAGNDNHGTEAITSQRSRTFVLAESRTKRDILNAMKNRRTYASLDQNIQCRYAVNGQIMGSTLSPATEYKFEIQITDPDRSVAEDKITKIEIIRDNGEIALVHEPTASHSVIWKPVLKDESSKYFFIRIYSNGGSDVSKDKASDPLKPIAWLAPVWTGR